MDLSNKLRYRIKKPRHRANIKQLGERIDTRPASVETHRQFGHWEIDTVVGKKSKEEDMLLTLVERKTRFTLSMKVDGKDPDSVRYALKQLMQTYGCAFNRVFKTITADSGSEFAGLAEALKGQMTKVYSTHPYSSWERGTNERHNERIRRFIPIKSDLFQTIHAQSYSKSCELSIICQEEF